MTENVRLTKKYIGGCIVILKRDDREIKEMIDKSFVGRANEIASMPAYELQGPLRDDDVHAIDSD